jgi:hypothetical protein
VGVPSWDSFQPTGPLCLALALRAWNPHEVLRAVLMEPDPIKRNQLAAPVLTNPGGQ